MSQYRIFVKDCLELAGKVKSDILCLSFDIRRDLLEKSVSSFVLEYIDTNIDIGDLLGLYDQYGTIYFEGIVDEIDNTSNTIVCTSNISYFKYNWVYDNMASVQRSTEEKLKQLFEKVFKNSSDSLMQKKYGSISFQKLSSNVALPFPTKEPNEVVNFEDFLYECYENYGIICSLLVNYNEETPVVTIDSRDGLSTPIKIGNNFNAVQNFKIDTDTFENNKLTIYSENGTFRGEFYATTGGITQNSESPLRLKKINSVVVFSDDDLNLIVQSNLQDEMYNHKISFSMLLNNSLYDVFNLFKLGGPVEIWYNGVYFNSILTGYQLVKEVGGEISQVNMICGKVRNTLTSKILKYVR